MKIHNDSVAISISNKFIAIDLWKDFDIKHWSIVNPLYKNWIRLTINTPLISLSVLGWLFFGKKSE